MKKFHALSSDLRSFGFSGVFLVFSRRLKRNLLCGSCAAALCLFFFCGCTSRSVPPLYGTVWKPVGKAPEGVHVIFTSDKKRVVGCCGSNRFFGPSRFDKEGKISVGMLGATRMATPLFRYEQKFLDDLKAADTWFIDETGALVLKDIDGKVCMRLEPAAEPGKQKR